MEQDLLQAGLVAIFGMVVSLLPFGVAVTSMLPAQRTTARADAATLSRDDLRGAHNEMLSGLSNVFRTIPKSQTATGYDVAWIAHGLSETFTPNFVAFSFLTAAWLCVAAGMRRQA